VEGLVESRLALDWGGFMDLPQSEMVVDIHCVTQWSRYDNRFRGVAVRDLLERARPKPAARFVSLTCYDGYTTNLALADFPRPMRCSPMPGGQALERQHGGRCAGAPNCRFWKSRNGSGVGTACETGRLLGVRANPQSRDP